MTKPVNYEELIWRLDALLRRAHIASEHRIVVGRTVLDSGTYTVTREGGGYGAAQKEFELLYSFCLIRDRSSPETSCWTGSGAMTRRVGRIP